MVAGFYHSCATSAAYYVHNQGSFDIEKKEGEENES